MEISVPDDRKQTVTLSVAMPDTRTSLVEDGRIVWTEGDAVYINNIPYNVIPDPFDPTSATIPDVIKSDSYLAAYSARRGIPQMSSSFIRTFLPAIQPYTPDGFATG